MRTIAPLLQRQYTGSASTLCQCLKMTLRDGTIVTASSIDKVLIIDGAAYQPWLQVSDIVSTATLGVDNLELTVITDDAALMADLEAGRYDNASFYLFETNYLNPSDGVNGLKRGSTGEVQITDSGKYTLELRGLTQALQQPVGIVTSRTCRAHFADWPKMALASRCGLDPADWTVTGTLTDALRQTLTDTARTEPDDWFGDGFITLTSGFAAGYTRQVKTYAAGVFGLMLPLPFLAVPGDTYSAIAGCRKRHDVDCRDKFNNILNFQGEPNLPGVDSLTKVPGVGT